MALSLISTANVLEKDATVDLATMLGVVCAIVLHVVALFGHALGGGWLLLPLFLVMLACNMSAILRVVLISVGEKKPGLYWSGRVPRWQLWSCFALIAYGILFSYFSFTGEDTYSFPDELPPEKAADFYGIMIAFFSIALLTHLRLSARKSSPIKMGVLLQSDAEPATTNKEPAQNGKQEIQEQCKRCNQTIKPSDWVCLNCGYTFWGAIITASILALILVSIGCFVCDPGGWRWLWILLGGIILYVAIIEITRSLLWRKK